MANEMDNGQTPWNRTMHLRWNGKILEQKWVRTTWEGPLEKETKLKHEDDWRPIECHQNSK